jgi:hypothetical protein
VIKKGHLSVSVNVTFSEGNGRSKERKFHFANKICGMDLQLNELHALIRLQNFIFKVWLHELAFVNIAISIGHGVLNHFSD